MKGQGSGFTSASKLRLKCQGKIGKGREGERVRLMVYSNIKIMGKIKRKNRTMKENRRTGMRTYFRAKFRVKISRKK